MKLVVRGSFVKRFSICLSIYLSSRVSCPAARLGWLGTIYLSPVFSSVSFIGRLPICALSMQNLQVQILRHTETLAEQVLGPRIWSASYGAADPLRDAPRS